MGGEPRWGSGRKFPLSGDRGEHHTELETKHNGCSHLILVVQRNILANDRIRPQPPRPSPPHPQPPLPTFIHPHPSTAAPTRPRPPPPVHDRPPPVSVRHHLSIAGSRRRTAVGGRGWPQASRTAVSGDWRPCAPAGWRPHAELPNSADGSVANAFR